MNVNGGTTSVISFGALSPRSQGTCTSAGFSSMAPVLEHEHRMPGGQPKQEVTKES